MFDLHELYQEVILDHGKNPRNFRVIEDADCSAEGYNPLCGDRVTVYLKLDGETISDVSFQGSACAICTASASMMAQQLKERSKGDANHVFDSFVNLLTAREEPEPGPEMTKLVALAGVRRFPMRVKCATLPWHTMKSALDQDQTVATTE